MTEIRLTDPTPSNVQITQLYTHLELFSEGDPPRHTLFVLGRRAPLSHIEELEQLTQLDQSLDQLMLIDPPADAPQRFRLEGDVAVLCTGAPCEVDLPRLQTQAGGVAHVRIGDHFLDIYSQRGSNVVHLPALGILCGGSFGSDATLPELAPGSDGSEELETLRLLARLVKDRRLQLYIPRMGTLGSDRVAIMQRLAADVAYLHGLRRVIPAMVTRGETSAELQDVAESLLPAERRSAHCRTVHQHNIQQIAAAADFR